MENTVLETIDVSKSFGGTKALRGVNFELKKGEILGLIGENGAGKSTLIKIIAGYYTKDAGTIKVDGKVVDISKPMDSLVLGIRVISQEFNLMNDMSVAENICIGDYPRKKGVLSSVVNRKEMNTIAEKILHGLGENISVTRQVKTLSVAEQQIVEIAKSLRKQPKILIMDEPTAALNDQETEHLFNLLKKLRNDGVSIIFITHRLQEQFEIANRVTVLRDGQLIGTINIEDATTDILVEMMVGKNLSAEYVKETAQSGDVIYEIRDLNVSGKLKNINLKVNKGEIVSVFGLLGQGQTELSRALIGDAKTESGEILIKGEPVVLKSPRDAVKHGIGFVSEDRKKAGLLLLQSTKRNISVASMDFISNAGFIHNEKENSLVSRWVDALRIKCSTPNQIIASLSGGNQQKALIARWLANQSEFIILNLPTRGVDVGAKYDIYKILESLCQSGMGVLVFSLELPEVLGISDRIYVIRDGEIVSEIKNEKGLNSDLIMASAVGSLNQSSGGNYESAN